MKYRVLLKIRWNQFFYDFDDKEEASIFLEKLIMNYSGNDEEDPAEQDRLNPEVYMTMISESPAGENPAEPSE